MSIQFRAAAAATLLLTSFGGAAWAAPAATPEGAAAIRAGLDGWISDWLGADANARVVLSAPIAVAPQGAFYAVKIPSLTATIGTGAAEDRLELTVDAIELRLTPQTQASWGVDWRLPPAATLEGPDGTTVRITIGGQSGTGSYSTALDTFTALDIRLADITAVPVAAPTGAEGEVAIDALTLTLATEAAQDLWNARATVSLRGLLVHERDGDADTKMTLAAFDGHAAATGLDVPALLAFFRGVAHVAAPGEPGDGVPGEGALGGVADVMDTTPKLLDTLDIGWSIDGFEAADRSGGGHVDAISAGVAIEGVRDATASARITAAMSGLDTPDLGPEGGDLTPRLIDVDLTIEDVPGEVMTATLKDFFRTGTIMGPDAALEMAAMQVYAALSRGEGVVRFDRLLVDFPRVGFDLAGRVWSAQNSVLGFAADMVLTVGGYKALYDLMRDAIGGGEEGEQFLAAFELLGQPTVDGHGRPGRRYQLLVDPASGKVTFNGTDIETLFQ